LYCIHCTERLGWHYIKADDSALKYKEGYSSLQMDKLVEKLCTFDKAGEGAGNLKADLLDGVGLERLELGGDTLQASEFTN